MTLSWSGEALVSAYPERSSGSRSETERSVGNVLTKAAAPAGLGAIEVDVETSSKFSLSACRKTPASGTPRTLLSGFSGLSTSIGW